MNDAEALGPAFRYMIPTIISGDHVAHDEEPIFAESVIGIPIPFEVLSQYGVVEFGTGLGAGGQVFIGIFGISVNGSVITSINGNTVCAATTACFQVGVGFFGGSSVNVNGSVASGGMESGETESVGIFWSVGNGGSVSGSVDVGSDNSLSGAKGGSGPGVGAAGGIQFYKIRNECVGDGDNDLR